MLEELPKEYDVIIIGTGVTESIIAAACARIGKRVLQVDRNDYYGSEWSSFSLDSLLEFCTKNEIENLSTLDNDENLIPIVDPTHVFTNRKFQWLVDQCHDESKSVEQKVTIDTLRKQSRKFNIDLTPKLLYAIGGLTELIVQSGVAKYSEYKLVSRILFERNEKLENVPSSRADVFNSNELSLIDKRLLMKVMLNFASLKIDELGEDRDILFIDYLRKQKLNANLCYLILNSIAMVDTTATTIEGFTKAKRYLESIGRFGNSPFLHQQYGSGEVSQCFSRLCAVFGGIQYLQFPLTGIVKDLSNQQCKGIMSKTGQYFQATDGIVCNHSFIPSIITYKSSLIQRLVLITNQSMKSSDNEEITFLRLNTTHQSNIHILEIGNQTGCSPSDIFLIYIFYEHNSSSTDIVNEIIDRLVSLTGGYFTRENILAQISFEQNQVQSVSTNLSKLFITDGPDVSIDYEQAINSAKHIFKQIYSNDEEFLPTPPDPEDIIIEEANTEMRTENS